MLKHVVLVQMLAYLSAKEAPLWFVDTHAGAGAYSLESKFARKLGEYKDGIGRLWERDDLPPALAEYLAQVRKANPDGKLRNYPGSPQIALQMLRAQDRLHLFELHTHREPAPAEAFCHGRPARLRCRPPTALPA